MTSLPIIGYKLTRPDYLEAARAIGKFSNVQGFENRNHSSSLNNHWETVKANLENAGVLDLWFIPLYEEQFKVGDWVVVTKEYRENVAKEGMILRLDKMDDSGISYKVADPNNMYDWGFSGSWCVAIRKATPEEIAKAQEKTFKVGDFEIVVKDGRAFHKSYNITTFVKELINQFKPQTVGGYMFEVDEVTFAKTGCQYKSTLKEWREVHKNLK